MLAFAQALPKIRERTDRDLEQPGLPREKVLATVVRLLEETRIRIGNDEYRRENGSYGLTTLRDRHVNVIGAEVRFTFRGKSGKNHSIELHDRRMARIIKRFLDIPGQELFKCVDHEGEVKAIDSADVNDYLRQISGEDFSAKDFRTWAGTILAARFLRETGGAANSRRAKKELVRAIARVADELGNTPAVAKKGYIHPAVIAAYLSGGLKPIHEKDDPDPYQLSAEERSCRLRSPFPSALAGTAGWGLSRAQDQVAGDRQQHKEGKDAHRREGGKASALALRRFHEDQSCALRLKHS